MSARADHPQSEFAREELEKERGDLVIREQPEHPRASPPARPGSRSGSGRHPGRAWRTATPSAQSELSRAIAIRAVDKGAS
jgi:hypothetical protein